MRRKDKAQSSSAWRGFGLTSLVTLIAIGLVAMYGGLSAAWVTAVLIAVEVAFSFDNAIVNAQILGRLSPLWQRLFLTVGLLIAVIGMRLIFPIVVVALTAQLSWTRVLHLALHEPAAYAAAATRAHPVVAAFGGAFLLMLALTFFVDDGRSVYWLERIEKWVQRAPMLWLPALISFAAVATVSALPANHEQHQTMFAGSLGILVYVCVQMVTQLMGGVQRQHPKRKGGEIGMTAFWTFAYLELLDASFSFDGVLGAFAITNKIILIMTGLGIGALWVRSLTVTMVRHGTLQRYIYLEHGAHYTIILLACLLLMSVVVSVPNIIAGLLGLGIIGASLQASRRVAKMRLHS